MQTHYSLNTSGISWNRLVDSTRLGIGLESSYILRTVEPCFSGQGKRTGRGKSLFFRKTWALVSWLKVRVYYTCLCWLDQRGGWLSSVYLVVYFELQCVPGVATCLGGIERKLPLGSDLEELKKIYRRKQGPKYTPQGSALVEACN